MTFDGIQAYAGQLSHKDLEIRVPGVEKTEQTMRELKAYVEQRGIAVREISGGSTGTVQMKAEHGVYTGNSGGQLSFSDTSYGRFSLPFKPALSVLATVVSKNPKTVIVDAGVKSFWGRSDASYPVDDPQAEIKLHEEHCAIFDEHSPLQVGDQVAFTRGIAARPSISTISFIWRGG